MCQGLGGVGKELGTFWKLSEDKFLWKIGKEAGYGVGGRVEAWNEVTEESRGRTVSKAEANRSCLKGLILSSLRGSTILLSFSR